MTYTPARKRYATPATLALLTAGGSVAQLAVALGVGKAAASHYLAGRRSVPPTMPRVLTDLVGQEATDRVLSLIPSIDRGAVAA